MTKRERVKKVLEFSKEGALPDRPPYSFWHHFKTAFGREAVEAHLLHLEKFDLDFLKVMNDNDYPLPPSGPVVSARQLLEIKPLPLSSRHYERQLELIAQIRKRAGDIYLCTTVFNPWNTLRNLTVPHPIRHGPPVLGKNRLDKKDKVLAELLRSDRKGVGEALQAIAYSVADFAKACIEEAGADGVFYSVRDDRVDTQENGRGTYNQLVEPADAVICNRIEGGTFNILHICGNPLNFSRFITYRNFQVVNWADRQVPFPSLKEALTVVPESLVICAGLDNLNTLAKGTEKECVKEAREALASAGRRPIIIAPGCTYDPDLVPEENLLAVARFLKGCK